MEASQHLSPTTTLDTITSSPQQYVKSENMYTAGSPSPAVENEGQYNTSMTQASPPPVLVQSKPAKKRKSWGQQLPEPTTTLPPRKRAKTDDEKEQRRIERIKRNRAAAHNSRERRRQEADQLAVLLARANAELDAYRRLHGPLPSTIVLPEVHLITKSEDTPAPSLIESQGTAETPSPASPPECQFHLIPTQIKQEPSDNLIPFLPPAFEDLDLKQSLSPLDQTQHSAAMLCDLQCRSSSASSNSTTSPASTTSTSNSWWAAFFLSLMTLHLQTCYKSLLVALWTISLSRMPALMRASALRLTSRSMTSSRIPSPLRSMAMAQLSAATSRLIQQGALVALQRSSRMDLTRTRVRLAATAQYQSYLAYQQRKALQGRGRKNLDDKTGDGNGGV